MINEDEKYLGDEKKHPRNEPSPENNEEVEKEDEISLPLIGEDEQGHQEYPPQNIMNKSKASGMTLREQYDELRDRDTTFVFLFGPAQSGKTAITSTMAYHMGTDEEGALKTRDGTNVEGNSMLNDIFREIRRGTFLDRTDKASVFQIDLEYTPLSKNKAMKFTFLEMSGEHFNEIDSMLSSRKKVELKEQIDIFLKAPDLDVIFILVVGCDEASEWDRTMVAFLTYIGERRENHRKPKVLLLVSKWDQCPARYKEKNDIEGFVSDKMNLTYSRLNEMGGVIDFYTVGEVQKNEIVKFNPIRASAVKRWMYYSITGERLPGGVSWWDRLLALFGI